MDGRDADLYDRQCTTHQGRSPGQAWRKVVLRAAREGRGVNLRAQIFAFAAPHGIRVAALYDYAAQSRT